MRVRYGREDDVTDSHQITGGTVRGEEALNADGRIGMRVRNGEVGEEPISHKGKIGPPARFVNPATQLRAEKRAEIRSAD